MKPILLSLVALMTITAASAQTANKNNPPASRAFIGCPVKQPKVKNGDKPNPELLKKLIQCVKGEAKAPVGYDGTVTVDVSSVQVGAPRKWNAHKDAGPGLSGTWVYPVKAAFTIKTYYRDRTKYSENWVRTFNFYVDNFGEWTSGTEVKIKDGANREVPFK